MWARQREFLRTALLELRRARSPAEFFRWQQALMAQYLETQRAAELARDERKEFRARIRNTPRGDVAAMRSLSKSLDQAYDDAYAAKASLATLRSLGDVLVWRTLRYRRGLITALGTGQRVQRLAAGRGLETELAR